MVFNLTTSMYANNCSNKPKVCHQNQQTKYHLFRTWLQGSMGFEKVLELIYKGGRLTTQRPAQSELRKTENAPRWNYERRRWKWLNTPRIANISQICKVASSFNFNKEARTLQIWKIFQLCAKIYRPKQEKSGKCPQKVHYFSQYHSVNNNAIAAGLDKAIHQTKLLYTKYLNL